MSAVFTDSSANALPITNVTSVNPDGVTYDTAFSAVGSGDAVLLNAWLTSPIVAAGPLDLSTGDFTIEFWFLQGSYGAGVVLANIGTDGVNGLSLYTTAAGFIGNIAKLFQTVGSTTIDTSAAGSIDRTIWNHFAVVLQGTTLSIYLNGVLVGQATIGTRIAFSGGFGLGNSFAGTAGFWDGRIDELRVSKVARYSANFTPTRTPFAPDANTSLLLHCDPPFVVANLQSKFAGPRIGKALMLANVGNINPRVYPPQVDVTARILPPRILS